MTCESCKPLEEENTTLKTEIEILKAKLKAYDNPNTPPSRKLFLIKRPRSSGKPGQKKGHPGMTRPVPEPDETVIAAPAECGYCGGRDLEPTGMEQRIVEDGQKPQRQVKVTEFLLVHCRCTHCGRETVGNHPDCPNEGRFGKNLITLATVMKYLDRLPYRKIRKALQRQTLIELSEATILDLTRRACDVMRPEYQRILDRIRRAKVVYGDETSITVNGKRCWIWVFVSGNDVIVVVADSRGRKVIDETLGMGFMGIIVCDGWKSYTSFTANIQRCWAHLLREADAVAKEHPEAAPIAKELHSIFDDCKEIMAKCPPPDVREQLWLAMNARLVLLLAKHYQSAEVQRFIRKVTNGFDYWFTFILHPYVEPTNNIAERALRENVIQRNIIKTLRNQKGMYLHETAMSVLTTWGNMGLNPYEELVGLLRS